MDRCNDGVESLSKKIENESVKLLLKLYALAANSLFCPLGAIFTKLLN